MLDAQQAHQEGVTTCLGDDSCACITKDDGQVGRRATGYHVAGILLMSRSVGDDELALVGAEIAIGYIDGDAFLALCLQSVEQQSIVNLACACISHTLGIALQSLELVFIKLLAIKQKTSDEG